MQRRPRTLALLVIGALALSLTPAASAVDIPANFTFTGAGLGHGVGMSQIGAEGMALDGRSATEILQYFYTGTTVTPVTDAVDLRVNLLHQAASTKIRIEQLPADASPLPTATPTPSTQPTPLTSATPTSTTTSTPNPVVINTPAPPVIGPATPTVPLALLSAADLPSAIAPSTVAETTIGIGDTLALSASALGVIATITGPSGTTTLSAPTFTLRWTGTRYLAGPGALINLGGATTSPHYRYGQLHIKTVKSRLLGNRLEVTDDLNLHDEYLRGIAEVPSSWPEAAMEAQVIAARSYALTKAGRIRVECDCDLYGRSIDLTYAGWAKESEPRWGQRWLAAVAATSSDATSGLAVLYNGKPITTFFFTSSGGHTQNIGEVWGTQFPWLKSVPDPWSLDQTLDPNYASWSRSISQARVAKAFALPDVVALKFPDRTQGGGIKSVVAVSSSGKSATLKGEIFRSRLGLPSTWLQRPVTRRSGIDETALSIAIGKSLWPTSKSVVLAVVDSDSLAAAIGAPLSFTKKAPLLFTSGQVLNPQVAAEIARRRVTKIYLVGINVPLPLITALKALPRTSLILLTGPTRYDAAAAVAAIVPGSAVLVANSDVSLLGSSIGALAAAKRPILFTTAGTLPWQSARSIAKKGLPVTVIGTTATILDSQLTGLNINDQRQPTGDNLEGFLLGLFAPQTNGIQFVPSAFDPFLLSGSGQPIFALDADGHVSDVAKQFIGAHPAFGAISVLGSSALVSSGSFNEIESLR